MLIIFGATVCASCGDFRTAAQNHDSHLAATYFGGSGDERVAAAAVDGDGNVYVLGTTDSRDLPVSPEAYDTTFNGAGDLFVAVFDPTLAHLLASTFLGGRGREEAGAIFVDDSGSVFVSGHTGSSDFPVTAGAFDTEYNGDTDLFVTRLSRNLETVVASTFIGGSAEDRSGTMAVATDGGSLYLAGWTLSADCPTLETSFQRASGGDWDVYLARLSRDLTRMEAATYFGGAGGDHSIGLYAAASGELYLAITTSSSDYPKFAAAYSDSLAGFYDIVVAVFDAGVSMLDRATYLGGRSMDDGKYFGTDRDGNVIVGGHCNAPGCPTTPGAFDTEHNGSDEGFISILSGDLTRLLASTYLGGPGASESMPAYAAASDGSGRIFVVGPVDEWKPTTRGAVSAHPSGGYDVFLYAFDGQLSVPLYATFYGGSGDETATVVAVGDDATVYLFGHSESPDLPVSAEGRGGSHAGRVDAFIVSLRPFIDDRSGSGR